MKTTIIFTAVAAALSLGSSAFAMTKADYNSSKDRNSAEYKSAKDACSPMRGNAKDICQAEAKGMYDVRKKELEVNYKPTDKNRNDVRLAKAEAAYGVAKEKCDDRSGNAKDVCVKEAKAEHAKAKANAKLNMEVKEAVSDANTSANKTSERIADARVDAAQTRNDADYKVAREKCDAASGKAKDDCLTAAKVKFGK